MDERAAFVAAQFRLPRPTGELRTAHRGAMGQIFCLPTVDGSFAVKELFWSVAEADVVREVQFRDAAARHGVPTPASLRTADGSYVAQLPAELGGKYVRVYTWVDGVPDSGTEVGTWIAGVLGTLHAIGHPSTGEIDDWYRKPPTAVGFAELIDRGERANALWTSRLRDAQPRILELISAVCAVDPDRVIMCHRDIQPQNVLRTKDGPVLVDWDDAGPAAPDWELATVLHRWVRDNGGNVIVGDLLDAYYAAGGTATISSIDQFTWVISASLNYLKAQVEVALDATGSMREFAERELGRILPALPTVAELAELQEVAARYD